MARSDAAADIAGVRDGLRSSSDPRVEATRAKLFDAVRELSAAGEDISVSSVAKAAGVGRATFYTHFSGIDDLALHLQETTFHALALAARVEIAQGGDALAQSQRALIAHYGAYRPLYAATFSVAAPRGVESRVAALMREEILAHIRLLIDLPAEVDPELAATYIAHAAMGLIASWVVGDVETEPERLAAHLTNLMPAWMSGPIALPSEIAADERDEEYPK
ncbi:TetR/AcrR family transcriptional regulator [Microbacterium sp. SLBN-111]|uniref:TetR/AcrR family transcriptional regulator n=1 Tax=Microbacterium sp. SLBN-111 TaxID=3377733 RepID=UPI003C7521C5